MPEPGQQLVDVDGVDQLYELGPDQFVAARDGLARRLKADGNRDDAAAVRALRRPTMVAWALNQVARNHRGEVDGLVAAGSALRRAQAAVMGGVEPGELRMAASRRRRILSKLAGAAVEMIGPSHRDDVIATLDAASLDPEISGLLRRGRLTKELQPPAGFGIAELPEPVEVPSSSRRRRVELERLRDDVRQAEEKLRAADDDVGRAEALLVTAQAALDTARVQLDRALEARDRARTALADSEQG